MISSIHPPLLATCLGPFSTIPVGGLFLVIYLVRLLGFTYFAHVHYLLTINLPWAMVAAQQEQEVSFLQWNLLQGAHLLLFDELQFSAQDGF